MASFRVTTEDTQVYLSLEANEETRIGAWMEVEEARALLFDLTNAIKAVESLLETPREQI